MDKELKTVEIGLFWHSPNSANLGVGALTLSNIAIIREVAKEANLKPIFKIFGFVDNREIYVSGDDISIYALNSKYVFSPASTISAEISKCDLVFDIGGGDSFTDIYGLKRFLFLSITKMRVLWAKVPLILAPQTIGPFNHWYTRVVAGMQTKKSTVIFARDKMSQDYAINSLGSPKEKTLLTTDVAFALPFTQSTKSNDSVQNVGINVSGLLFNGGYSGENEFGLKVNYPELMKNIISYFLEQKCTVHLIPHVVCDDIAVEDDYAACEKLAAEYPEVILEPSFADPVEAKTAIAKMDLFMGARMHSCIASISSGVPVIPMAYSRKFGGLFGALGYMHTVDCLSLSTEDAFQAVKSAHQNVEQLKIDTAAAMTLAEDYLGVYKKRLAQLLLMSTQGG